MSEIEKNLKRTVSATVRPHPLAGLIPGYDCVWIASIETVAGVPHSRTLWRPKGSPTESEILGMWCSDMSAWTPGLA